MNVLDFGGQKSKSVWSQVHDIIVNAVSQEFLHIWHKRPLRIKDVLITFWWSRVKMTVTSYSFILENTISQKRLEGILLHLPQMSTSTHGWIYYKMFLDRHACKQQLDQCLGWTNVQIFTFGQSRASWFALFAVFMLRKRILVCFIALST